MTMDHNKIHKDPTLEHKNGQKGKVRTSRGKEILDVWEFTKDIWIL